MASLKEYDLTRRIIFYLLLASLLADAYASRGETLMHFTLWAWTLQTLYFSEHVVGIARYLHGPAFGGSVALWNMYLWTLYANPNMEFDLAPEGRPHWLIVLRALWMHLAPVIFHVVDYRQNQTNLQRLYGGQTNMAFKAWTYVLGYLAMGLIWENVNGEAAATYNVTVVSEEVYINTSKAIGIVSCLTSCYFFVEPLFTPSS